MFRDILGMYWGGYTCLRALFPHEALDEGHAHVVVVRLCCLVQNSLQLLLTPCKLEVLLQRNLLLQIYVNIIIAQYLNGLRTTKCCAKLKIQNVVIYREFPTMANQVGINRMM